MPWVEFIAPFTWSPPERNGRVDLVNRRGEVRNVRRQHAEAAIAAGKARAVQSPDPEFAERATPDVGG